MPNDSMKGHSITDTEAYKGLAESQGWWVCSTCGAHFPPSSPAVADDGVTQCSSCVNVAILSKIISAHFKRLSRALELLRSFRSELLPLNDDFYDNQLEDISTTDLLLTTTAFLDETSLLLMHWEKDIPHV